MSITKTILRRQTCCQSGVKPSNISLLILLIEKNSMFDEEYSSEDQTSLKEQLINIVKNLRSYFSKVILSDVILHIFEDSSLVWEQPYFLLDFISLLKDRVAHQIQHNSMDIEVPVEYFDFLSEHFELINTTDEEDTMSSVSTPSQASDATVTYSVDELAGQWAPEQH